MGLKRILKKFLGSSSEEDEKKTTHLRGKGLPDYDLFVSRKNEVEKGIEFLKFSNRPVLIVEGKKGIGKTSYLDVLKRTLINNMLIEKNQPPLVSENIKVPSNPDKMLQRVYKQWAINPNENNLNILNHPNRNILDEGKSYLLCIDDISKIQKISESETKYFIKAIEKLTKIARASQANANIILTGTPGTKNYLINKSDTLEGEIDKTIKLSPLSVVKTGEYMKKYLDYSNICLYSITEGAQKKAHALSKGIPSKLNKILLKLIENLPTGNHEKIIDTSNITEIGNKINL
ncbi:MAG: AAA family ATPase [Candidatus Hadarchaeota archaeon]